jgi:hypothetical protein
MWLPNQSARCYSPSCAASRRTPADDAAGIDVREAAEIALYDKVTGTLGIRQ